MDTGISHAEELGVGAGTVTLLPSAARPGNLPVALSSFVGRERELRELRNAPLSDERRVGAAVAEALGCVRCRA